MADLILRQARAVIDSRTTVICLDVAGVIVAMDEPFDTMLGEQMDPPFHIHCRTIDVPWMPGFIDDIAARSDAELQRRPMKQRRKGPNGEAPRLPPKSDPLAGAPPLRDVSEAAGRLIEQASTSEKRVTPLLKRLVEKQADGEMLGLDFRLKEIGSLTGKIQREVMVEFGGDLAKAASSISDALRYTAGFDVERYAESTQQVIDRLRAAGYSARVKNSWGSRTNPYRGINVAMIAPDGQKFELQFHTAESFALKNATTPDSMHDLYRRMQESSDQAEKDSLTARMFVLSRSLAEPPGARTVE